MELSDISRTIQTDAALLAFVNVLLQQLGLPVPAVPTLMVIGSLTVLPSTAMLTLVAAVSASVLADAVWYVAGRMFGYRLLNGLCRLSINPGSCVTQTESRFARWGVWSLVVAKFIPGFSTVAPPIAGSLKMPIASFLLASGIGAALWAGLALTAGWLVREELQGLLSFFSGNGTGVIGIAVVIVSVWILWKFWQKARFEKLAAIPHIKIDALMTLMNSDTPPLLLDLRGAILVAEGIKIAGARIAEHADLETAVGDWPKDALIVTLCACPQDAGAVQAARAIMAMGYRKVQPLDGGFEAWQAFNQRA